MRGFAIKIALVVVSFCAGVISMGIFSQEVITRETLVADKGQFSAEEKLEQCQNDLRQFSIFEKAREEVGSQPYSEDNNCYDHTKAMQRQLAAGGIESSVFINEGRNHAWLAVWIEATTGRFIGRGSKMPSSDFWYRPIEIRDGELEVICQRTK